MSMIQIWPDLSSPENVAIATDSATLTVVFRLYVETAQWNRLCFQFQTFVSF